MEAGLRAWLIEDRLPDRQRRLQQRMATARTLPPLVGLDIDRSGKVYTVTACAPDSEDGPFRSAILAIGRVEDGGVVLDPAPTSLGSINGLKAESIALCEKGETPEVFVQANDENLGGALRLLPQRPDR